MEAMSSIRDVGSDDDIRECSEFEPLVVQMRRTTSIIVEVFGKTDSTRTSIVQVYHLTVDHPS